MLTLAREDLEHPFLLLERTVARRGEVNRRARADEHHRLAAIGHRREARDHGLEHRHGQLAALTIGAVEQRARSLLITAA
jgi:hypothetical protein